MFEWLSTMLRKRQLNRSEREAELRRLLAESTGRELTTKEAARVEALVEQLDVSNVEITRALTVLGEHRNLKAAAAAADVAGAEEERRAAEAECKAADQEWTRVMDALQAKRRVAQDRANAAIGRVSSANNAAQNLRKFESLHRLTLGISRAGNRAHVGHVVTREIPISPDGLLKGGVINTVGSEWPMDENVKILNIEAIEGRQPPDFFDFTIERNPHQDPREYAALLARVAAAYKDFPSFAPAIPDHHESAGQLVAR